MTRRFPGDGGTLAVTVCSERIVRVELEVGAQPRPSFVLPRAWPAVRVATTDGESVRMATSALTLDVAASPTRLTVSDASGAWLLREPDDGGLAIDGGRRRARFAFSGEQHFYGLGQGGGPLDRLGTTRQLWNTQLGHGPGSDMSVPLLLSNRGYAILFDNP